MTKRDKYIKELNDKLENYEYKDEIIEKYTFIIDEKIKFGRKITNILNELGSTDQIIEKEMSSYAKKNRFKELLNNGKSAIEKTSDSIKDLSKEVGKKISKIKNKIKFKRTVKKIKSKVKQPKVIKIKEKKTKKVKEKKIKPIKNDEKTVKVKGAWVYFILQIILFIILFYSLTLFMASGFAILDKVKIYGICLFLFSFSGFLITILSFLDRKRYGLHINSTIYFISLVFFIITMSLGVGYTSYKYFDIQYVSNISEKYSLTYKSFEYKIPKNNQLHIYFNSWYKNKYIIEIDDTLEDSVEIDIRYYEAFYDLNVKNEAGNIYVSLGYDVRDLISMYIENLKDNKIYNEKEFSRYMIKIYVSEENAEKLVIHN